MVHTNWMTTSQSKIIPTTPCCKKHGTKLQALSYPNQSLFILGDWLWNGGVTKSQASFDTLMDIIRNSDFHQDNIHNINWGHMNNECGAEDADEWLDDDASWTSTPILISVPFKPCQYVLSPIDA